MFEQSQISIRKYFENDSGVKLSVWIITAQ